ASSYWPRRQSERKKKTRERWLAGWKCWLLRRQSRLGRLGSRLRLLFRRAAAGRDAATTAWFDRLEFNSFSGRVWCKDIPLVILGARYRALVQDLVRHAGGRNGDQFGAGKSGDRNCRAGPDHNGLVALDRAIDDIRTLHDKSHLAIVAKDHRFG